MQLENSHNYDDTGGLLYTLVSCILWYCIILYQAIYNCKNEHNNQKRRQRINYQSISKQQSFTLWPIDVQSKVRVFQRTYSYNYSSKKSQRKTVEKGASEATTTCDIAKIINEAPGTPWSYHRSFLFFKNKKTWLIVNDYFENLLVMDFEPLFSEVWHFCEWSA